MSVSYVLTTADHSKDSLLKKNLQSHSLAETFGVVKKKNGPQNKHNVNSKW